ncbi:MAG: nucleoside hydrolase [Sphaerochaetaceae bacterium]|jgi:purine nucleosidase
MKRILFDSDLLGDDLLALYAMVHDKNEIVGVTAYGRRTNSLERCRIAQVFLEDLGAAGIPLVPGADSPILQPALPGCTFCDDEMQALRKRWNADKLYGNRIVEDMHAAQFLIETSRKMPGLSLLCTGPLTNIALAILLDPEFPNRLEEIVLMGGVHGCRGNSSAVAEANIYNDPEAAKIVFEHCRNILVVPLDVTLKVVINDALASRCDEQFIRDVSLACCHAHVCKGSGSIMPLHDLLAYLALSDSTYVSYKQCAIQIETGWGAARGMMILGSPTESNAHRICFGVDSERVLERFEHMFARGR